MRLRFHDRPCDSHKRERDLEAARAVIAKYDAQDRAAFVPLSTRLRALNQKLQEFWRTK